MFILSEELKKELTIRYSFLKDVNVDDSVSLGFYACGCYGTCRNTCGESCYQR